MHKYTLKILLSLYFDIACTVCSNAQMSTSHENNRLYSKSNAHERGTVGVSTTSGKSWKSQFVDGKKNCIWALVKHILPEQGPVDGSRDYTLDERIFHAPCIFVPDVSNPCRIEHSPNFPRRWNARERKALRFVYGITRIVATGKNLTTVCFFLLWLFCRNFMKEQVLK